MTPADAALVERLRFHDRDLRGGIVEARKCADAMDEAADAITRLSADAARVGATVERRYDDVAPAIEWTPADKTPGAYRVGHSKPPHRADGMTAHICIGDGAYSTIPNPQSYDTGGIVWHLTWASDVRPYVLTAASIIGSFDYLLSGEISMKEATRRLRMMRAARAALAKDHSR